MRGEILCIGDELISGRISDLNARYAAGRLWPLGLGLAGFSYLGDDPDEIVRVLRESLARCDWLVVSGGLGTTEDDLTAAAAARALGLPLIEHPRKLAELEALITSLGRQLTPEIRRMALMPEGAEPLDPRAAGFTITVDGGKPLYFLPGVPPEFQRIIERRVAPELGERFGSGHLASATIRLFGLGESEVGRRLAGLVNAVPGAALGYYPVYPEVILALSARAETPELAQARVAELEAQCLARLADWVVVRGAQPLEARVGELLLSAGQTLALAESCTGGLIGHRVTEVAGSSAYFLRGYVVYSNPAKQELLGVTAATLASHGAVSAQCAAEMAAGARERAGADLALAVTGIAGPEGGSPEKPVGTVWFGLAHAGGVLTEQKRFPGDRQMVKLQAAENALDLLRRHLEGR